MMLGIQFDPIARKKTVRSLCGLSVLMAGLFALMGPSGLYGGMPVADPSLSKFRSDDNAEAVQRLLKEFWAPTKFREADAYFQTVDTTNADVVYAYALVKSRQHDVKTALKTLSELEKIDPHNVSAQQLKVWLLLRKEDHNLAIAALGKFIDKVKADKKLTDFERSEAYRFAGRVFGFMEGPAKGKANQVAVDATKRKILFKLDGDLLNVFMFDYSAVLDKYKELTTEKKAVDTTAAEKDKQQRKVKFAQLTELESQLKENQETLTSQSQEILNEARERIEELRAKDAPLASSQQALESELNLINRSQLSLIREYNYWNTLALRERDPSIRSGYFWRANDLDGEIILIEVEASRIRSQINAIENQRAVLQREYNAISGSANRLLSSIQSDLNSIETQKKRTANEKQKTTKPTRKIVTRSVSLKVQARTILTYDKFPLEIERQILLDKVD